MDTELNMRFIESALSDISHYMKHLLNVRFIMSSLKRDQNDYHIKWNHYA